MSKDLVRALDTDDDRARRRAEDVLLSLEIEALPILRAALSNPTLRIRRSAARLLGRLPDNPEARADLIKVLEDDDPKVRKLAAASLGRLKNPEAVEPLKDLLDREELGWVRASAILALGSVGGERAYAVLGGLDPEAEDPREREALRKAIDRLTTHHVGLAWNTEVPWTWETILAVPRGLEAVALEEAREKGLAKARKSTPGRLRLPSDHAPWEIVPTLRCVYRPLIPLGKGPPLKEDDPDMPRDLGQWVASLPKIAALKDILVWKGPQARYRLSVESARMPRGRFKVILKALRAVLEPHGLVDSPSSYDLELSLSLGPKRAELLLWPAFAKDDRFNYRKQDVGASINPVVGAALARLVRTGPSAVVRDPTCGSGTLLIERGMLDERAELTGGDVSPTSVAVARDNVAIAGMMPRTRILKANAVHAQTWRPCDEVIANLPFGIRTRREGVDIHELYGAIVEHTAANLREGGRAVFYTTGGRALMGALDHSGLTVEKTLNVEAGDLSVGVWVLGRG